MAVINHGSVQGRCRRILPALSPPYLPTVPVLRLGSAGKGTTPAAVRQDHHVGLHLFRLMNQGGERGDTATHLRGTHTLLPRLWGARNLGTETMRGI